MAGSKPSFWIASQTRTITKRLLKAKPGEVVSYAELARLLNEHEIAGNARAIIAAKHLLLTEHGMRFESERGVGQKRLTDRDIVAASEKDLRKLHRTAVAGYQRLGAVTDYDKLDNADKLRHTIGMTVFNATVYATSEPALDKLAKGITVSSSARELPIKDTLALFAS